MKNQTESTEPARVYVALCPNYWGKGSTVDEAKKNMKEAGGSLQRYFVKLLPVGATEVTVSRVDGTIEWIWAEGADRTGKTEVVASRGVK